MPDIIMDAFKAEIAKSKRNTQNESFINEMNDITESVIQGDHEPDFSKKAVRNTFFLGKNTEIESGRPMYHDIIGKNISSFYRKKADNSKIDI